MRRKAANEYRIDRPSECLRHRFADRCPDASTASSQVFRAPGDQRAQLSPDQRMKPDQRLHQRMDRRRQIVAAAQMAKFMRQDGAHLATGTDGSAIPGGKSNTGFQILIRPGSKDGAWRILAASAHPSASADAPASAARSFSQRPSHIASNDRESKRPQDRTARVPRDHSRNAAPPEERTCRENDSAAGCKVEKYRRRQAFGAKD